MAKSSPKIIHLNNILTKLKIYCKTLKKIHSPLKVNYLFDMLLNRLLKFLFQAIIRTLLSRMYLFVFPFGLNGL